MTKKLAQPVTISTTPAAKPVEASGLQSTSTDVLPPISQPQQTLLDVPETNMLQKPIVNQMTIDGNVYTVEIRFIKQSGGLNFYSVESGLSKDSFVVNLFMDNPYFKCYNELLKDEDSAGPMLHIIQALVATEIQMISKGLSIPAKTYRDILNNTIGKF